MSRFQAVSITDRAPYCSASEYTVSRLSEPVLSISVTSLSSSSCCSSSNMISWGAYFFSKRFSFLRSHFSIEVRFCWLAGERYFFGKCEEGKRRFCFLLGDVVLARFRLLSRSWTSFLHPEHLTISADFSSRGAFLAIGNQRLQRIDSIRLKVSVTIWTLLGS